MRAEIEIRNRNVEHDVLLIEDKNGPVSVTNDAEAVVKFLYDQGYLKGATVLYYIDSEGKMDELKHDGQGRFTGFSFGVKPHRSIIL